ncbi:AN1-type zinc finger protein 3 isoform X2 [Oryzias latipes]
MGDTSGRSEAALPPRCPCGFWGSSKTLNLCSKCFADVQKKQPEDDCTPPSPQGPTSSQPLTLPSTSAGEPIFSSLREGGLSPQPTQDLQCTSTKRPREAASSPESGASPEKRLREGAGEDEGPRQKNRRRCFHCQSKLELVQQELGSCRCGQCSRWTDGWMDGWIHVQINGQIDGHTDG